MRLLPEKDQDGLWAILREQMGSYFKRIRSEKGLNFKLGDAKTIPGEEEGYYAILGVNYLTNVGNVDDFVRAYDNQKTSGKSWALNPDKLKKYGMLDLGGSSTQIAVPKSSAPAGAPLSRDNTAVHSFLSMGMEKAREAVIEKFGKEGEGAPCFFQQREDGELKKFLMDDYQWGNYTCMKLIKQVMSER